MHISSYLDKYICNIISSFFYNADRLDGLARKKNETKPQTMEDFLQVPDYYDMEDTSGKKRVCIRNEYVKTVTVTNYSSKIDFFFINSEMILSL